MTGPRLRLSLSPEPCAEPRCPIQAQHRMDQLRAPLGQPVPELSHGLGSTAEQTIPIPATKGENHSQGLSPHMPRAQWLQPQLTSNETIMIYRKN